LGYNVATHRHPQVPRKKSHHLFFRPNRRKKVNENRYSRGFTFSIRRILLADEESYFAPNQPRPGAKSRSHKRLCCAVAYCVMLRSSAPPSSPSSLLPCFLFSLSQFCHSLRNPCCLAPTEARAHMQPAAEHGYGGTARNQSRTPVATATPSPFAGTIYTTAESSATGTEANPSHTTPEPSQRLTNSVASGVDTAPKSSRGAEFTPGEDVALAKAWIQVSGDSIAGADQKGSVFYSRVKSIYNEGLKPEGTPNRSFTSLKRRFDLIKSAVVKFSACYSTVKRARPTGVNEHDIIRLATAIFNGKKSTIPQRTSKGSSDYWRCGEF